LSPQLGSTDSPNNKLFDYGLDELGIISNEGGDLSFDAGSEAQPTLYPTDKWRVGSFPRGKIGWSVKLTTDCQG
jgi:hypothetical protein